jgi:hypothetical protein
MTFPDWRRLRSAAGLTAVEGMVAGLMLIVGGAAVMAVLSTSNRNTYRAEQGQVVVNRLQDELEQIKQLPYEQIALAEAPDASSDPRDPSSRISGTSFDVTGDGGHAPLVFNGSPLEGGGTVAGGTVAPGPTEFASGDVKGDIHRYVVWLDDPGCDEALCPGAQDVKRVVVAIRLDETPTGGERAYQELHEDIADPEAQPQQNPGPNDDGDDGGPDDDDETDYPWSFWLTDTTCNNSSRQPITGDHNAHNTLGSCSNGTQTANTPGAPDLMFPEAPPLNSSLPADEQPLYDYSADVEPSGGGTLDKGVQLRRATYSALDTCALGTITNVLNLPVPEANRGQKLHKWLTPAIPSGVGDVLLTGDATLNLWTQTLNGAEHAGKICVYLFRRTVVAGLPVDELLTNVDSNLTYWEYEEDPWPRNGWQKLEIPLDFVVDANLGGLSLVPNTRLGVAIRLDRDGTTGNALQLMYDHPSFDSRLVVDANRAVPF